MSPHRLILFGNYRICGTALISGDDFASAVAENPVRLSLPLSLPLRHFCFRIMAASILTEGLPLMPGSRVTAP